MTARWSSQELSVNDDFTQAIKRQRICSDLNNPHQAYNCTMSAQQYGIPHGLQAISPSHHHRNPHGHMIRISDGQHGPYFPQVISDIGTEGCHAYQQSEQHHGGLPPVASNAQSTSKTYAYQRLSNGHNFTANPHNQSYQCLHSLNRNTQHYGQQPINVSFPMDQLPTHARPPLPHCGIPIECHYPVYGTSGEHQHHLSPGIIDGNAYDAHEWEYCGDFDAICGPGCRVPCDTPPGQCEKPNRCDSPVLDCLERCHDDADNCRRQDKCDSVECEAQGFCPSLETDIPIFDDNAYITQGILQGSSYDPFENLQATPEGDDSPLSSIPPTPVLASTGMPSFSSPFQPEFPGVSPSEPFGPVSLLGVIPTFSDVRGKPNANSVEGTRPLQGIKSEQYDEDCPVNTISRSGILINGSPPTPGTCNQGLPVSSGPMRKSGKAKVDPSLQSTCELGNGQSMTCQWLVDGIPCGEHHIGNNLHQHWVSCHKPSKKGSMRCRWAGCTCGKSRNTDKLNRHVRSCHTKHIAFQCEKCNRCFAERSNYNQHLETHSEDKQKLKCLIDGCHKEFASVSTRKTHIEQCHEGRLYTCDVCPYECNDQSNMRKHKRSK